MKRILAIVCFAGCLFARTNEEPAPYLAHAARITDEFILPQDKEIEEYFTKIRKIRTKDISSAVKNYQKFIRKYGSRVCKNKDIYITVARKVHMLLRSDQELLEEYRRQFGPTAFEGFKKARAAADIPLMKKNGYLYFPAEYGENAVLFLASYYLDHGQLDRALEYTDILRSFGTGSRETELMRNTIYDLLARRRDSEAVSDITLKDIDTEQPAWIGGVALSTVYPEQAERLRRSSLVYPILVRGGRVIVNTGLDIYCYDSITGRHMWKPGPFHRIRTVSLFAGDSVAVRRMKPDQNMPVFPVGTLAADKGQAAAAINKSENPTCIAVCSLSSGKLTDEITGDSLAELMKMKGIKLAWGRPEIGSMPCIENDTAYICLRYIHRKREQGLLAAYSLSEKNLLWVTEIYETRFRYPAVYDHPESIVRKSGPYLTVFSFSGYIGVFNAFDGSLLWQRFLFEKDTEPVSGRPGKQTIFIPAVVQGLSIIEGPLSGQITAYDTATGRIAWQASLGKPVWAVSGGKSLICAAEEEGTIQCTCIDISTGSVQWKFSKVSSFPGCRAGDYLFCSDGERVLKIDIRSGSVAEQVRLKGCTFPGRILVSARLFVVNSSGVFAYEHR